MLLQRIGKSKQRFKTNIIFLQILSAVSEKGTYFKVKLQRGDHEVSAISQACRKGKAKFKNSTFEMPLTLYLDQDTGQFLEKQGTIKAYVCDERGAEEIKIGQKAIDFAEFAQKGELELEVELESASKIDSPVVKMQINLFRMEQQAKSIKSQPQINMQNVRSKQEVEENNAQKIKQKYRKTAKARQNYTQSESRLSNAKVSVDRKSSKDREQKIAFADNSQQRKSKQTSNILKYQQITVIQDRPSKKQQAKPRDQRSKKSKTKQVDQQGLQLSQRPAAKISKSQRTIGTQLDQFHQSQIAQLKKILSEKQTQINGLKRQNENLQRTVDQLIRQNSCISNQQASKKQSISREDAQAKKTAVSQQATIDQLSATITSLESRQEQHEKTILSLRHSLIAARQKQAQTKYKIANFMQQLFETSNKQALEQACRHLAGV